MQTYLDALRPLQALSPASAPTMALLLVSPFSYSRCSRHYLSSPFPSLSYHFFPLFPNAPTITTLPFSCSFPVLQAQLCLPPHPTPSDFSLPPHPLPRAGSTQSLLPLAKNTASIKSIDNTPFPAANENFAAGKLSIHSFHSPDSSAANESFASDKLLIIKEK